MGVIKRDVVLLTVVLVNIILGLAVVSMFKVPVHEGGHLMACRLIGGTPLGWTYNETGAWAECEFPEDMSEGKFRVFVIGGIGTEFAVATLFLLALPVSMIGGIWYLEIGYDMMFEATYSSDFGATIIMQQPIPIMFFVVGIVMFCVSMYITLGFAKWFMEVVKRKRKRSS